MSIPLAIHFSLVFEQLLFRFNNVGLSLGIGKWLKILQQGLHYLVQN